ncbi:LysR family transcriptional regulator [Marinobacterium mangrovicola]|uniref:LysR family transcriptional regulator n=1 Tax=Marinobacterium mangrovicola TaxID=1476959 RepID=A0A4R1GFH4_9GAMM|nr:LysR family transcriptional regulator [Marinobacterium mangrovicola]
MNIKDIDLNLLKVFDAIQTTKSVSEGAALIGLSQPAMSFALSKLRRQFNDQLFVRTAKGMTPTARAMELADPVSRILETVNRELLQEAEFDPARAERTFTFSMSDIGEMVFLPKLLKRLLQVAPGVSIKTLVMPPARLERAMEEGEVDLALGYFPDLVKNGFYQQRLFRHNFATIARADHPVIGDSLSLEQFIEVPHAIVTPQARSQEIFHRMLAKQGIKRNIVLTIPHFMSVPFIVSTSDLIVTLPRAVGTSFAQLANIKVLEPPLENPVFVLKQHWHVRFHKDPANRWMRSLIYELFHEEFPLEDDSEISSPEPWEL